MTLPIPEITDEWDQRMLDLAQHIASWSKDPSTKVGAAPKGQLQSWIEQSI